MDSHEHYRTASYGSLNVSCHYGDRSAFGLWLGVYIELVSPTRVRQHLLPRIPPTQPRSPTIKRNTPAAIIIEAGMRISTELVSSGWRSYVVSMIVPITIRAIAHAYNSRYDHKDKMLVGDALCQSRLPQLNPIHWQHGDHFSGELVLISAQ